MPGRVLSVFRDVEEVKKGRNWGWWRCNLFRVPSCFMRRRYAWMRCLFFRLWVAANCDLWLDLGRGGTSWEEWNEVVLGEWNELMCEYLSLKEGEKWAKRRVWGRQHLPILRPQGLGGCKIPPIMVYKTYILYN